MILNRDLRFPDGNEASSDVKDLIDKLLQINPSERLGGGPESSHFSYTDLKRHPFFHGINFDELSKIDIPIDRTLYGNEDEGLKKRKATSSEIKEEN
jgi:serine/threonine protein kinase